MPLSVGTDIVEIYRVAAVIERWQEKFLRRVYTPAELLYCRGRVPELAARFAGKEAISKALGTGIRGFAFRDVEVVTDELGKPAVVLHGRAAQTAARLGVARVHLSLTHTADLAVAHAVAERD